MEDVGFQSRTWMPRPLRVSSGARAVWMVRVIDSTGGYVDQTRVIAYNGNFNCLDLYKQNLLHLAVAK